MSRVLIVEDEDRLAHALTVGLRDEGYLVDRARDGAEALWSVSATAYDALVLDLRLPKLGGVEVCRRMRADGRATPVLILTACDAVSDVVAGLDAGGDDYVTKPFAFEELLARLRALLRRAAGAVDATLKYADLELDLDGRAARRGGRTIELTAMEFRLLEMLLRRPETVATRARIVSSLWDDDCGPDSNVLEVLVSHLRRKIDRDAERPLLRTVRGVGYVLRRGP